MARIVLIDGNSILNRAFYGIMGNKMLMTKDGTYTNAVYGFLAIMFKVIDDLSPEYMMVAFDLKAPTERHKLYEGYKATRKGMPNELAVQMPIIKEILQDMNITIIEKEGYEADDVLGTMAKRAEEQGLEVTIVSGDRDTFQLASDNITIRIPHTKAGKTETDNFNKKMVIEKYGVEPKALIEVKGLQGDTSDNIPGVPGIGEKTALNLIKEYKTIDKLYEALENGENTIVKGKTKERLQENKELAYLSRTLGTINTKVPIAETIEQMKQKEWNMEKILVKFRELNFTRFIKRFELENSEEIKKEYKDLFKTENINTNEQIEKIKQEIKQNKKIVYYINTEKDETEEKIIKQKINSISIVINDTVYYWKINENDFIKNLKEIMEDENIKKYSHKLGIQYVLLRQIGIESNGYEFDAQIAAYDINPGNTKNEIEDLSAQYMELYISDYLNDSKEEQISLFGEQKSSEETDIKKCTIYAYVIQNLSSILLEKLKELEEISLFNDIEMPLVQVLGEMQYNGMYIDKQELIEFGEELKNGLLVLTKEIYELCGEEFNINSTKQLGTILFEKLKLPVYKKTKSGYSTDVDILEKLKEEHPVIEKILEYRSLTKLNSTYVEGLIPYINEKTHRIHSYFHQTITATGRISSTEPNLQNIPTRMELGKKLRKVFKPKEGYVFVDADYSQVELRILAHISKDRNMKSAFLKDEDIHKQVASKVFEISQDEVTDVQRTEAKAVNFGIVYGISDFGLAGQLGIPRKKAKEYIEQYLSKYKGIARFMKNIVEEARKNGYVKTLFNRRRYIKELSSNNYTVRQFGARAAMNTPIQGTAADIMKIAMINVNNELKKQNLDAKLILQIHDELIIECNKKIEKKVQEILQKCMESASILEVPLKVDVKTAQNWYEAK